MTKLLLMLQLVEIKVNSRVTENKYKPKKAVESMIILASLRPVYLSFDQRIWGFNRVCEAARAYFIDQHVNWLVVFPSRGDMPTLGSLNLPHRATEILYVMSGFLYPQ